MSEPLQFQFETLTLGGHDYQIRSLLDRQLYDDPDGAAARAGINSATWPLFGMVWPASKVLAETMCDFPIAGKRILEVGCGTALASIVLRQQGADITASDLHPMADPFLAVNLALNDLEPIPFDTGSWSDGSEALGEFDLIIGSDLLYERDHPSQLADFIDRHGGCDAEVILVDPKRGQQGRFGKAMAALGFEQRADLPTPAVEGEAFFGGRVLNFVRGPTQEG